MKVLVTGGAGFIGFHVAQALIQRGDEVVIVDNLNDYYDVQLKKDRLEQLRDKVKFYQVDISNYEQLKTVFAENHFDKICNLAAQAGVRYSLVNPFAYHHTNGEGLLNILELMKEFKVMDLVFASSSSVYGGNEKVPFSVEDNVDLPVSIYAATKKYNELMAHVYHQLYGLNCFGLRFFTVYGPWGRPDMALYKFTKNILSGKPIEVYNYGDHERDFTYITDIVDGVLKAIDQVKGYDIFNFGNNDTVELMDFISLLEKELGITAEKKMLPMQKGDVHKTYADIEKTKSRLGWEPHTKIEEGVKHFVRWYKKYHQVTSVKSVAVVGLGYVGLPLALRLSQHFSVIGFDVNEKRIGELKAGQDSSGECNLIDYVGRINFTSNSEELKKAEFVIVCVPTPVNNHNKPDLVFVESASEVVGKNLAKGTVVVYESTVYPGVTEEVCVPILENCSGLKCGVDFKVGYSPERMNPGDKEHVIDKITKIVSGMDQDSLEIINAVYSKITKTYQASSIKVAEAAKVIENIQRDLNISLMNELAIIFSKMNLDTSAVLEAAGTKWNFHQYHPGLVGGHCFDKNSLVYLIDDNNQKISPIGSYIDSLSCKKQVCKEGEIFYLNNVKILSYDLVKNTTLFKPVTIATKRKTDEFLNIKCVYNYSLKVTDRHPVIVYDQGRLKIKWAMDITVGDKLVLNKMLPSKSRNHVIDLLEHLDEEMYDLVRVKIKDRTVSEFREIINKSLPGKKGNFYNWNYLPLRKYLAIEKKLGISRKEIYLGTGRGSAFKEFPCIFKLDSDFMRLMGYYLSEGCISKDKSLRTRFTFHKDEKEYINDVTNILKKLGLDFSIYHDKTYKATTINVSSYLFGFLLKDILQCGTNCYNMKIPQVFFNFNKKAKKELLKGLFRGDGGVKWCNGKKAYLKKEKNYAHNNNSIEVSYFTSSPELFQQVLLLLLNQNILPKLAKRKGYLSIVGSEDVMKVKDWFFGDKKRKVDNYFKYQQKKTKYPFAQKYNHYMTINVIGIERKETDYVYSMEVDDTHTLITTGGFIAHNCIGVDPYYLTYKAEEVGYHPEVILAGRRINDNMHKFYAEKMIKRLYAGEKKGEKYKVLILGLTFKPNVADYRNSRVKHLIEELKEYNIDVLAYDPYLSKEVINNHFGVNCWKDEIVDLIVMATEHDKLVEKFSGYVRLREL